MIHKAIAVFSCHKYFEADHSRALFIRSHILHCVGDGQKAQEAFEKSILLRRQVVPVEAESSVLLGEEDFDEPIAIWHK